MTQPRFSVVVPAFNEAEYLPRLLDSIDVARERFSDDVQSVEVIVANNGSTDDTAGVARARGCRVVDVAKRAIAAARNGGAAAANGEIVCFIDADSRVHPESFNAIDERMRTGRYAGGGTGWVLERRSLGLMVTALVVRILTGLARVNGGVIFCRPDIFKEIGGYNEDRRFAEDVAFFAQMRRVGRTHGLDIVLKTGTPATISTRKFDRHGDWHMLYMWLWVLRDGSLAKTVDKYWYNERERF